MIKRFSALFIVLVLIFMYAPILILMAYSFTSATTIGAIRGFSLHNYVTLFTTPDLRNMIFGTVLLALVSATLATILGTMGAIGAFYSSKKVDSFISTMNQIPVVNADVVTGFSICILLVVVFGVSKDTFIPLVVGHVTLCAPFVYLSVVPKLKQMDPSLYEAASIDGAGEWTIFRRITLPMTTPILAVNALNSFLAAYNSWEWAFLVCQKESHWTLAVWMYQMSQQFAGQPWCVMAGFVLVSIPTAVVFLACQKVILRGIVLPSMK